MKKLYITFLVLVLALAMIVPVVAVNAGSQVEVSGNVVLETGTVVIDKFLGNEVNFVDKGVIMGWMEHNITYTGSFEGTAVETLDFRVNFYSGAFNSEGIQTFTDTVLGQAGTFTAQVRHQGGADGVTKVEQTIISGTGDLANLHGTLIFMVDPVGIGVYEGTYSGELTFAP